MDSECSLYLRLHGKVHGPMLEGDLRALALDPAIIAAAEIASTSDGPWSPFAAVQPALRVEAAGSRTFARANQHDGDRIELKDIIAAANRRPNVAAVPAQPAAVKSAAHDVASLLRLNLAVEKAHGFDMVKPRIARPSRRRRDYVLLMTAIGVLIAIVLVVESFIAVQLQVLAAKMPEQLWPMFREVLFHSPIIAWGLAAFCFYAIALGWLMFGVMDEY